MLSTSEVTEQNWKMRQLKKLLPVCRDIEQQAEAFTEGKSHQDKTPVEKLPKSLRNCAN